MTMSASAGPATPGGKVANPLGGVREDVCLADGCDAVVDVSVEGLQKSRALLWSDSSGDVIRPTVDAPADEGESIVGLEVSEGGEEGSL